MTLLLNGFELAKQCRAELAERVKAMPRTPKLAVILVGDNPASAIYVRNKEKAAAEVGVESLVYRLDSATQEELTALIEQLNADETVDGILVQMPLPAPLNEQEILQKWTVNLLLEMKSCHQRSLRRLRRKILCWNQLALKIRTETAHIWRVMAAIQKKIMKL